MPRLYVPPEDWTDGECPLSESEARHAVLVLRSGVGDRVGIFDGEGRQAEAEITAVHRRGAALRMISQERHPRRVPGIHLILALIKGERFEWAVQKATELGAASIRPVAAERSVVRIEPRDAERRRLKWRQTAVEAAKQCGLLHLPEIHAPVSAAAAFGNAPAGLRGIPAVHSGGSDLRDFLGGGGGEVVFAIGPEGDWTGEELAAARSEGFVPLDLGSHVLRSETAALYVLSATTHQILGGAGGLKSTP